MDVMHVALSPDLCKNSQGFVDFVDKLMNKQIQEQLPILTIYVFGQQDDKPSHLLDACTSLFVKLAHHPLVDKHHVKLSVLGKWYDLSDDLVQAIKTAIISTKDYDGTFLNFCINYDGQDDIVESAKLVTRKVLTGKMSVDDITTDAIKDNVYSSFFLPPSVMILLDGKKQTDGLLLWDSAKTPIMQLDTPWYEWNMQWPKTL
jgi:undecaprenyl diphosphate synthase